MVKVNFDKVNQPTRKQIQFLQDFCGFSKATCETFTFDQAVRLISEQIERWEIELEFETEFVHNLDN